MCLLRAGLCILWDLDIEYWAEDGIFIADHSFIEDLILEFLVLAAGYQNDTKFFSHMIRIYDFLRWYKLYYLRKNIWFYLFLQGHENKFTVYVHSSKEKPVHVSRYFVGRDIRSEKVSYLIIYTNILYDVITKSQTDTSAIRINKWAQWVL